MDTLLNNNIGRLFWAQKYNHAAAPGKIGLFLIVVGFQTPYLYKMSARVSKYRGFDTISSIPALRPSCWYFSRTCPVTPMIAGYLRSFYRIFLFWIFLEVASIPLICGILKSVNIILQYEPTSWEAFTWSTASDPVIQKSTL